MSKCTCAEMAAGNTCPACALRDADAPSGLTEAVERPDYPPFEQDDIYEGEAREVREAVEGYDPAEAVAKVTDAAIDAVAEAEERPTLAVTTVETSDLDWGMGLSVTELRTPEDEPDLIEHGVDANEAYIVETDERPFSWTTWIGHPECEFEYGFNRVNDWLTEDWTEWCDGPAKIKIPEAFPAEWVVEAAETAGYDVAREYPWGRDELSDHPRSISHRTRYASDHPDAERVPVADLTEDTDDRECLTIEIGGDPFTVRRDPDHGMTYIWESASPAEDAMAEHGISDEWFQANGYDIDTLTELPPSDDLRDVIAEFSAIGATTRDAVGSIEPLTRVSNVVGAAGHEAAYRRDDLYDAYEVWERPAPDDPDQSYTHGAPKFAVTDEDLCGAGCDIETFIRVLFIREVME